MTSRENFPVGSRLIRRDLRAVVAAFYVFARRADDVADAPDVPSGDKLLVLASLEAGLDGDPAGRPEGLALAQLLDPAPSRHARQLLRAFRADARSESCATGPTSWPIARIRRTRWGASCSTSTGSRGRSGP